MTFWKGSTFFISVIFQIFPIEPWVGGTMRYFHSCQIRLPTEQLNAFDERHNSPQKGWNSYEVIIHH